MSSSTSTAAGSAVLPSKSESQSATQAAWRFYNNENVTLSGLVEPLRDASRMACAESSSDFSLLIHDWCKLEYDKHSRKKDLRQLTHEHDIGYDLTTSLFVDAATGDPIAPVQLQLKTADEFLTTSPTPLPIETEHLDQLGPTMDEVEQWAIPRKVVHVIDREADSLGHFRKWIAKERLFLVRANERRVTWQGESWLISEISAHLNEALKFEDSRGVLFRGKAARQEISEVSVILERPHKTMIKGKQKSIPGKPVELRLVFARVVDQEDYVLSEWWLLTNVPAGEVTTAEIALWYYWRWNIESFFKLLKSHGQQIEHWQQETGAAIARRLLVAAMACVFVWELMRQQSPEAKEFRDVLIQLSGRRMKRGVEFTAPALLAGYFVFLAMSELFENTDFDMKKLKSLASPKRFNSS